MHWKSSTRKRRTGGLTRRSFGSLRESANRAITSPYEADPCWLPTTRNEAFREDSSRPNSKTKSFLNCRSRRFASLEFPARKWSLRPLCEKAGTYGGSRSRRLRRQRSRRTPRNADGASRGPADVAQEPSELRRTSLPGRARRRHRRWRFRPWLSSSPPAIPGFGRSFSHPKTGLPCPSEPARKTRFNAQLLSPGGVR